MWLILDTGDVSYLYLRKLQLWCMYVWTLADDLTYLPLTVWNFRSFVFREEIIMLSLDDRRGGSLWSLLLCSGVTCWVNSPVFFWHCCYSLVDSGTAKKYILATLFLFFYSIQLSFIVIILILRCKLWSLSCGTTYRHMYIMYTIKHSN